LSRAALRKGFAEGLRGFAESLGPRQSSQLRVYIYIYIYMVVLVEGMINESRKDI
jgi:hypothetical protein